MQDLARSLPDGHDHWVDGLRVLLVSPLADLVADQIRASSSSEGSPGGWPVTTVQSPGELEPAIRGRLRHDVALVDVTWNDPRHEWDFDGLDVLGALRREERSAAVIMAAQGHSFETEHLREALDPVLHPEVVGAVRKSDGLRSVLAGVELAAAGGRLREVPLDPLVPLHRLFSKGRGRTAARLAAAVASGRASRYETLAEVANVSRETAAKLVSYLGPIMASRGEPPPGEPLTQAAVYRWCGENARYLLSWNRRHDPTTSITRWRPG
jgi:hypothetical protein